MQQYPILNSNYVFLDTPKAFEPPVIPHQATTGDIRSGIDDNTMPASFCPAPSPEFGQQRVPVPGQRSSGLPNVFAPVPSTPHDQISITQQQSRDRTPACPPPTPCSTPNSAPIGYGGSQNARACVIPAQQGKPSNSLCTGCMVTFHSICRPGQFPSSTPAANS